MGRQGDLQWIIGAADRMVTTGDIEFEQEQRKIQGLTTSISLMVAGDLSVQADVIHRLIEWRDECFETAPDVWLKVKDAADKFYEYLADHKRKCAHRAILEPLGIDMATLNSGAVAHDMAMQLSKEILEYRISAIEAIVMGQDPSGQHIYVVDNSGVSCQDWTGFAAIGGGAWHANSQMTFAQHVKTKSLAETIMLVYTAKRRAEVAPGVGEQTDMVAIGPNLSETTNVGEPLMDLLKQTYEDAKQQAERVRQDANATIEGYFGGHIQQAAMEPGENPQIEAGETLGEQRSGKEGPVGEEASG